MRIPTGLFNICIVIDTREKILTAMFSDVHLNGFQGLRADKVITEIGVTKGALYHYFPTKQSIGLSIIDEMIEPMYLTFYNELDVWQNNPIDKLQQHLSWLKNKTDDKSACLGCPLNNLVQEMSPVDEQFRLRLERIVNVMHQSTSKALSAGQANNFVKSDFDCDSFAWFYLSAIEGASSMSKVTKSAFTYAMVLNQLKQILETLRED